MTAARARPMSASAFATPSTSERLKQEIEAMERLDLDLLRQRWRRLMGRPAPSHLSRGLMIRILAYRHQVHELGGLDRSSLTALRQASGETFNAGSTELQSRQTGASTITLKPGTLLAREYGGVIHRVMVREAGYLWNGRPFRSLSEVALSITGTKWNGPRFFGLRPGARAEKTSATGQNQTSKSSNAIDATIGDNVGRVVGDRAVRAASMEDLP